MGWLVGMWNDDCLGSSSLVRNLMVHCLLVRSQANSYQFLEILREDRVTKGLISQIFLCVRVSSSVYHSCTTTMSLLTRIKNDDEYIIVEEISTYKLLLGLWIVSMHGHPNIEAMGFNRSTSLLQ
jgi:hypothetical protein